MRAGQETEELKVLACDNDFALISTFTPTLPHSLLVQVMGLKPGARPRFSLYVVYREADMTFEATAPFAVDDANASLDDVLARYVGDPDFTHAILGPLQREVRRHFRR